MGTNAIRAQKDANDLVDTVPRKRGVSGPGSELVWGMFMPLPWSYHPRTIVASKNDGATLTFRFVSTDDKTLSAEHSIPLDDIHATFTALPNLIPKQPQIENGETVGVLMVNPVERPRSMSDAAWAKLVGDASDPLFIPSPPPEKWPRGAEIDAFKRLRALARFFADKASPGSLNDPVFAERLRQLREFEGP